VLRPGQLDQLDAVPGDTPHGSRAWGGQNPGPGCHDERVAASSDPVSESAVPRSVRARITGLPRGVVILVGMAAAVVTLGGLREVRDIAAPIFMALCLTVTLYPVRSWLIRKRWPSWLATTVLVLATMGAVLGLVIGIVWSLARFATILPEYSEEVQSTLAALKSWLAGLGIGQDQIQAMIGKIDTGQVIALFESILSNVLDLAAVVLFIITLILFMGVDGAVFPARMAKVRGGREPALAGLGSFAKGTRKYFGVSTVFGGIVAIIDGIVLILFGIPGPVLWALLAFITNYIPNVGFIIGLIPVAFLALLTGGVSTMVAVIVTYCVVNFIIQSVIQPKYVGDSVGLTTTVTFVSLIVWTFVLGPLGAILAVPATLLAKALLVDVDPDARWLQLFLGDEPVHNKPPKPAGARRFGRHPSGSTPAATVEGQAG
jgi:AI-2 transport protein TqsA